MTKDNNKVREKSFELKPLKSMKERNGEKDKNQFFYSLLRKIFINKKLFSTLHVNIEICVDLIYPSKDISKRERLSGEISLLLSRSLKFPFRGYAPYHSRCDKCLNNSCRCTHLRECESLRDRALG